ncbi:MAG TPA: prepilin-type N-terminal cleavage/methylation domain-containing protein [Gaiellaceae bacterium]|nr:prepilin-type N-terminal cleavage/methylation domain-containing protein [Gaiellaceae bacterium]
MNTPQHPPRGERGFTMVELVVVLVVLVVLVGIAVPAYLGFKDRASSSKTASNVRSALPSVEAYFADHGDYDFAEDAKGNPVSDPVDALASYDSGIDRGLTVQPKHLVAGHYANYCISESEPGGKTYYFSGPGGKVSDDPATAGRNGTGTSYC